jgi:hypothetical protein
MSIALRSICLAIVLAIAPVLSFGQDANSIDWFNYDANYHSKTLLLKLLQFTAPYPLHYEETSLDTAGNAFTGRIVPNWAVEASVNAKLDSAQMAQVKQMLAQLSLPSTPAALEPQQGQLHSVFIFYDGADFVRLNYNGPVPAEIDAILAILHKQFVAAEKARSDEFLAHEKLIKETYGDWLNRSGITINAGGQMHGCRGNRALMVLTAGQRKTDATALPTVVSVYHALVFYPGGAVMGAGSGGRWSDDPVQSYVVIWKFPNANGSWAENTTERKLEILHNAIDATVTVGTKTYRLDAGNMFIIRIGADWLPSVTQLHEKFEEQATPQTSLNCFKTLFKDDASIQGLELY